MKTLTEHRAAVEAQVTNLRSSSLRWNILGPCFPIVIGFVEIGFVYHDGYPYQDSQSGGWRAVGHDRADRLEGNYTSYALAVTALFERWRERHAQDPEIGEQATRNVEE